MDWTWLGPVLSLIGALFGGLLAVWFTARSNERRAIREQVREARIAVERCVASRLGPDAIDYPGMDPQVIAEIQRDRRKVFFERYFDSNFEAKAALGAVKHLDAELSRLLDKHSSWRLEEDEISDIRLALNRIDKKHA